MAGLHLLAALTARLNGGAIVRPRRSGGQPLHPIYPVHPIRGRGTARESRYTELQAVALTLFGDASPETCRRIAHGNAVLGCYVAGGTVVSCGSTDWVFGLAGGDRLVEAVTRNALGRLSR